MSKFIEEHNFTFDNVFGEEINNDEIYLQAVRPMIEAAFRQKAKVTCFAYGQTGSGKTHTMMGPSPNLNGQVSTPGLYLLSGFDLFNILNNEYSHLQVFVSFYEIYCGKLHDLLNERTVLIAREDGKGNICITNLQEKQLYTLNDLMKVIEIGLKSRTVGVTGANADSSRSHGIIQIVLKTSTGNIHGKISFIDLAGSERAQDTVDTDKQTRIDGAEINKSLLALKECIRALDQNKNHTPFRGSKLTMVLRDSFVGGNCKTLMIANISPSSICAENTLNTLRYADRVKELKREKQDKPNSQDQKEDLGKLMMMPRSYGNTVKYSVDKNIKSVKNSNPSGMHIQNMFSNESNNPKSYNQDLSSLIFHNQVNNRDNIENKPNISNVEHRIGNLLNKPSSTANDQYFDQQSKIQSKFVNHEKTAQTFQAQTERMRTQQVNQFGANQRLSLINVTQQSQKQQLSVSLIQGSTQPRSGQEIIQQPNQQNKFDGNLDFINNFNYYKNTSNCNQQNIQAQIETLTIEHEKMISEILKGEDDLINRHRGHVDLMVDSIKRHMQSISEVDQSGSDINQYIEASEKRLETEIECIRNMQSKFKAFKILIMKEQEISQKIAKLSSTTTANVAMPQSSVIQDQFGNQQIDSSGILNILGLSGNQNTRTSIVPQGQMFTYCESKPRLLFSEKSNSENKQLNENSNDLIDDFLSNMNHSNYQGVFEEDQTQTQDHDYSFNINDETERKPRLSRAD